MLIANRVLILSNYQKRSPTPNPLIDGELKRSPVIALELYVTLKS
ncbi:MAG: hypothetical protein WCP16_25455 [Pseudanabaena sp. ELA645]